MNLNVFLCVIIMQLVFLESCNNINNKYSFIMPNQELFKTNLKNSQTKYQQYQGFKAKYNDTILREFTFIFNDHWEKVGRDILTQEQIEQLKSEQVIEIKFDKIDSNKISECELLKYMKIKYCNSQVIGNKMNLKKPIDKEFYLVSIKSGELLSKIDFIKSGKPGFVVRIIGVQR